MAEETEWSGREGGGSAHSTTLAAYPVSVSPVLTPARVPLPDHFRNRLVVVVDGEVPRRVALLRIDSSASGWTEETDQRRGRGVDSGVEREVSRERGERQYQSHA